MSRINFKKGIKENKAFVLFFILYLFTRTAYADWSPVPSGSMEPTIQPGDVLLINKTAFGPSIPFLNKRIMTWGAPARGDIITFVPPHTDDLYVKRVIGLPGDEIRVDGTDIFINGTQLPQELIETTMDAIIIEESIGQNYHSIQFSRARPSGNLEQIFMVPDNKYFVMGDHRNNSADSRVWGFVDEENIMGKVERIAVSFSTQWPFLSRVGVAI